MTGTKVFLLVGFDGLQELLTQYNPDESTAFICQDSPANRFFIESILKTKNVLYVDRIPTNVELFLYPEDSQTSQSIAFHKFNADDWLGLLRIPELIEQFRVYLSGLGPIKEIIWHNRLDLWVSLILSIARQLEVPTLRTDSVKNSKYKWVDWDCDQLKLVNPMYSGLIAQLNKVLFHPLKLTDVYLEGSSRPIYSGLSPDMDGVRQSIYTLNEIVSSIRRIREQYCGRLIGQANNSKDAILFIDDGLIDVPAYACDWRHSSTKLRRYFSELSKDVPVTIKTRPVPIGSGKILSELVQLFPIGQKITFVQSLMPAEFLIEDYRAVFFMMSSCMVWPFDTRRVCLFPLLKFNRVNAFEAYNAWVQHWDSLSKKSLIISNGNSVNEDLAIA